MQCIVGLTFQEAGQCAFDFFSLGHICMGIGIFLFWSLFYTIPKSKGRTPLFSLLFVFILTIICGIIWEIIENTLFFELGLKFEGLSDSGINIMTDILLVAVGGLGSWLYCYLIFEKDKKIRAYYIFGLISFAIWLIFFFILRYITKWYSGLV